MPSGVYSRPSVAERFWSKVNKRGSFPVDRSLGRCWEWTAGRFSDGYGGFSINRIVKKAHRVSWDLAHPDNPVDEDELVCHKCDNPPCVRPSHLFKGSFAANSEDMVSKGRSFRPKGPLQGSSKLSWSQVRKIRSLEGSLSQSEIAKKFGVSQGQVWRILRRLCWEE